MDRQILIYYLLFHQELESLIKKDDDDVDLKDVEFEYVIEPIDVTKLQGDNEAKDEIIDQFTNIIRHFQKGKEDDMVIIKR